MKKILRLVTTSVLTLTLVACGEASSSVSSNTGNSSVSSTVGNFANVSTITLSAETNSLTQVMGTLKKVAVQATLNANTDPSTPVEWFVEGTKSNQTGRIFEFTPNEAGEFKVQAKVGSIISNTLTIKVGLPTFAITAAKAISSTRLELTADAGAQVVVKGNTVQPESFYDLENKKYVIILKTALSQGDVAEVTLTKAGVETVTRSVAFDTRELDVAGVSGAGVTDNKNGTWDIERPHSLSAGATNTSIQTNVVSFKSANISGKSVEFKIERVSAPTGADAFATIEGLAEVDGTNAGTKNLSLNLTKDTVPGAYVFKFTLGKVSKEFTLNVVIPKAKITLDTHTVKRPGVTPTLTGKYEVFFNQGAIAGTLADNTGIVANAAGAFEITKDYVKGASIFQTIKFSVDGANFLVPENQILSTSLTPNQVSLSILGPNNLSVVRTQTAVTQEPIPTAISFRDTFSDFTVVKKIDAETPSGEYTFSINVRQLGQIVSTKEVKLIVKDPAPKLSLTALSVAHVTTVAPASTSNGAAYWYETGTKTLWKAADTTTWLTATKVAHTLVTEEPTDANSATTGLAQDLPVGTVALWRTFAGSIGSSRTEQWKIEVKGNASGWETSEVILDIAKDIPPSSASNSVLYPIKSIGTNLFEVQKPSVGAESHFISLPYTLTNLESPATPLATLENSFTGHNSVRKEFLNFKKSYTGPGTLNSNFTLDSKIAIEIGTDTDEQTGLDTVSSLALTNAKSYSRYRQLATFNDNVINLGNQFVFELNSLTSTGDYLFTLEVGSLKEVVTVKVLPSTPEVDLSVLTRPNNTGNDSDPATYVVETNTVNVAEKYFFTLGADGKYYGNLGWDSPETTGTNEGKITADLSLLIKNMDLDDVPYTVSISYPSRTEVFSNVLVEGAAGNLGIYNAIGGDGHLNAPYLLFLATGKAQSNSAIGTFGTNTVYNTAAGTLENRSNLYAKSFSRLDIEEAGTYKITITVNGVSDSVELVVGKRPTLTVDSVTNAVLFDGVYLAKDGTADLKVTFNVKASNLPAVTFFKLFDSFIDTSDADFYNYATEGSVTSARDGIESGRLSETIATTGTQLTSLAFNATTGLFGIDITVPAAAASGDRIRKTVGIYTRTTNYTATQFTYNLIGEFDVLIWNNVKPTN
jgi:hypothetical protein